MLVRLIGIILQIKVLEIHVFKILRGQLSINSGSTIDIICCRNFDPNINVALPNSSWDDGGFSISNLLATVNFHESNFSWLLTLSIESDIRQKISFEIPSVVVCVLIEYYIAFNWIIFELIYFCKFIILKYLELAFQKCNCVVMQSNC